MHRSCFQTDLSNIRMKDLRLNEKEFVKIAMWFPSILNRALNAQEMNLISMLLLKRKKHIEKSFGQIGVKYLLFDNDFSLFSCNN